MKILKVDIVKLLISLAKNKPVFIASVAFVAISTPINHFFLKDKPNNWLERAEEIALQQIIGVDIDLNPDSDR
jgi:hypothetical protein